MLRVVHACVELLPDIRDLVRIFSQTVHQESKYALYDFDTGPPLKNFIDIGPPHMNMRQLKYSRVPEWGDCMAILLDSVLSRLSESVHGGRVFLVEHFCFSDVTRSQKYLVV